MRTFKYKKVLSTFPIFLVLTMPLTFSTSIQTMNGIDITPLFNEYGVSYPKDTCRLVMPSIDLATTSYISKKKGEIITNFAISSVISIASGYLIGIGTAKTIEYTEEGIVEAVNLINKLKKTEKKTEKLGKVSKITRYFPKVGLVVGAVPPAIDIVSGKLLSLDLSRINNKDLYKIEYNLYVDLLDYFSTIMTCYKIEDPEKLNKIEENLIKLDKLVKETKIKSNEIVDKTSLMLSSVLPVKKYNNWEEFEKTYKETLDLINSLRKEPTSLIRQTLIDEEAKQVKTKILLGEMDINDLKNLDKEVLKRLLKDKDVLKKLKEKYPLLSEKDKQFFIQLYKEGEIGYLNPDLAIKLNNLENLLKGLDTYVPVVDLIQYLEKVKENPFLDKKDVEEAERYVVFNLRDRLLKQLQGNPSALDIINLIDSLNERNYETLLPQIINKMSLLLSINNFTSLSQYMEKYVNAVKILIDKYSLDLTQEYLSLINIHRKLKEHYRNKKLYEIKNDLLEFEKIKKRVEQKIQDNLKNILEISRKDSLEGDVIEKDTINLKKSSDVFINFEPDLFPVLKGVPLEVYSLNKKDVEIVSTKVPNQEVSLIKKEGPFDWHVRIIILKKTDLPIKLKVNYLIKNVYKYNIGYSLNIYNVPLAKVRIILDSQKKMNITSQLPINTGLKYAEGENLFGSVIYITPPKEEKRVYQFTFKERGIGIKLQKGETKKYFTKDRGEFLSRTDELIIQNLEPVSFYNNTYTISVNSVSELDSISVIDNYGNIIYSDNNIVRDKYNIPISVIYPGENKYYITYIYVSKEQKMKNGLKEMERKYEEIQNYLELIKEKKGEIGDEKINKLLVTVNNELERLKNAVRGRDYEEYTEVMNDLKYDIDDLYKETIDLLNQVLGTEKTINLLMKDVQDKTEKMKNLLEQSKTAFTEKEYKKYQLKISEFISREEEIKELIKFKELDTALNKLEELKLQVDSYYTILKERVLLKRFLLFNRITKKILTLENILDEISKYDPNVDIYKMQLESYLSDVREIQKKTSSLDLTQIVGDVENEVDLLEMQVKNYVNNKLDNADDLNKGYREFIKKLNNIKNTIKILKVLGIDKRYYVDLEEKLYNLEESEDKLENLLQKYKEINDPLLKYYYYLKVKDILDKNNIKLETQIDELLDTAKEKLKKEINKKKEEVYVILKEAEEKGDTKLKIYGLKVLKELNNLESQLDSADNPTDLLITKKKLDKVDTSVVGASVQYLDNTTRSLIVKVALILLILITIGGLLNRNNRERLFKKIEGIKKKIKKSKDTKKNNKEKNIRIENPQVPESLPPPPVKPPTANPPPDRTKLDKPSLHGPPKNSIDIDDFFRKK